MTNKLKTVRFKVILSVLLGLLCFQTAYCKYDESACKGSESKLGCLWRLASKDTGGKGSKWKACQPNIYSDHRQDFYDFVHNYLIVISLHERYYKEFGAIPAAVWKNAKDVAGARIMFEKYVLGAKLSAVAKSLYEYRMVAKVFVKTRKYGAHRTDWALWYCSDMYNKEMNDLFGSDFSPTSDAEFSKDNYLCYTSYEDALENIYTILNKYRRM